MNDAKPLSYLTTFWCLAVVAFAIDLGSKYAIFHMLYREPAGQVGAYKAGQFALIPDMFEFHVEHYRVQDRVLPRVNHGALFGLGQQRMGSNTAFAVISLIAAVAIIFWCTRRPTQADRLLCVSLGLILGGTVGNLYDRLAFGGVRDFLHFYLLDSNRELWFDWPIFNLADTALVCGAGLLLVHAFFTQPAPRETETPVAAESQQMVNAQ